MNKYIRPNLFIIGAMKSGTTYLHDLLSQHPSIYMSKIKEPCYFINEKELKILAPQIWNTGIWRRINNYIKLFEEVKEEKIIGESSTLYAKYPKISGVPQRILKFNPEARFIYIMRDPIERTISHFWHDVRIESKMLEPYKAITNDPHYINVSYYSMQLKQHLQCFNLDRFYICTFEKLINDPENTLQEIFKWLNIDSKITIKDLYRPKNVSPETIYVSKYNLVPYKLRASSLLSRLNNLFPYFFCKYFDKISKKSVDKYSIQVEKVVEYLRPIQKKQTEELKMMLDMDFHEWKTLNSN